MTNRIRENRFILSPSFIGGDLPGLESIAKPDWLINRPKLPNGDMQLRMSVVHQPITKFVSETVRRCERPVSIVGDCCAAIAMLAGLQQTGIEPYLIWFDAHGDFNTWETTPSGFLGGMPLAMIVGRGDQRMPVLAGLRTLAEDRVILTDARDLDPGEGELIAKSNINHILNVETLLDYTFPDGPIYVHFDTDIVSSDESPAQNYPAGGGPSSVMVREVFSKLAQTNNVVAVSLSSWNPAMDTKKASENISLSLLDVLVRSES